MALQHLRSSDANKRPIPTLLSAGQIAINTNEASPGVFVKDSNGDLVKVGPVHVGTSAPNSSPASTAATALVTGATYQILTVGTSDFTLVGASANTVGTIFTATGTTTGTGTVSGQQGNEKGEMWLDTTGGTYVLKVYDGSAWRSESGTFVDVSGDTMTGALLIDNAGSVTAPDLGFSGDANTGIYQPGNNQLAITTNGVQRLRVDGSGRVGINRTGTLSDRIEVGGTALVTGVIDAQGGVTFGNTSNFGDNTQLRFGDGNDFRLFFDGSDSIIRSQFVGGDILVGVSQASSGDKTSAFVFSHDGYLGIGNASPSAALSIADPAPVIELKDTDTNVVNRINANSGHGIWYFDGDINDVATDGSFIFRHAGTAIMTFGATGTLTLGANSGTIRRSGDTDTYINFNGSDQINFFTANTERLSISSTLFDINTNTDITGTLDVSGDVTVPHLDVVSTGNAIVDITAASGSNSYLRMGDADDIDIGQIIYDSGNHMRFFANNAERMRIEPNGRVGIGDTNPQAKLHVKNADLSGAPHRTSAALTLEDSDNSELQFIAGDTSRCQLRFGDSTSNYEGAIEYVHGDDRLEFVTDSSVKAVITSGGALGVGVTSPQHTLDVAGDISGQGQLLIDQAVTNGTTSIKVGGGTDSNHQSYIDFIGDTTYPTYGLRVIRQGGGANANSEIIHRGTGSIRLNCSDAGKITFLTNATEKARFTSAGDFGIGLTAPLGKLHVKPATGTNFVVREEESFLVLSAETDSGRFSNTGAYFESDGFYWNNGVNTKMTLSSSGQLGIGKSPSVALDVSGEARSSTSTSSGSNSKTLTTKDYVDSVVPGAAKYITAYGTGTQDCTSVVKVKTDQTYITSGTGDFTVGGLGKITVINAGIYQVSFSITTDVTSGSSRSIVRAFLSLDGGLSEVTASRVFMYARNSTAGEGTASKTMYIQFAANDGISLHAVRHAGSDTTVIDKDNTTISIFKVA